ncbi:hypothetical protein T492DRAFT_1068701 [Pavlovales sp. CCMP2436]|nr:hypothetical protein T492DRAFT_1068701 [Pavlovales sp. CCMP2436]|mmetsp:Transcript_43402/g.107265  ORF Transcript_43402/g.107265 Transcript_43402/m.107265 type:complete len:687 (+) Transcript_43402:106-2166(+)
MTRTRPWQRLHGEEEDRHAGAKFSESLSVLLRKEFDPIRALCQHVWATLGGRVEREDCIALCNALRMSNKDVKHWMGSLFASDRARLSYSQLLAFVREICDALPETRQRISNIHSEDDGDEAPSKPSVVWVMFLCALAPFTWPLFASDPRRLLAIGDGAWPLAIELVLCVGYAPLVLYCMYQPELQQDRVSLLECVCPALAITFMCLLKAFSIGLGWFHSNPANLHAWRRLRVQHKFMMRFRRNRILLQKLGISVYGVESFADARSGVWSYELIQYLEQTYARPEGLVRGVTVRRAHSLVALKDLGTLLSVTAAVGLDALLRDSPAPPSKQAARDKLLRDPYYDGDVPDALDRVTHSLSIAHTPLYSAGWFVTRLQQRLVVVWVVIIALLSPAIPCLVRWLVHSIPFLGSHPVSKFVVLVNIIWCAPSLLIVLLTLTTFLDMLEFRKRLLRGLTATVRPDLAATYGVRVALDLREAVNLSTWSEVIIYLRRRCLDEEVRPFNSLLLPVALLDLSLCAMFIYEWVAMHTFLEGESQAYVISALDILSALSVTWLSVFLYVAMSRACEINIALEQHAEVLENTQVEMRGAIRALRRERDAATDGSREATASALAVAKELAGLEETDFHLTAIVRKTRNVDINKPFKLLGVSITTSRLRALGTALMAGFLSGVWRQLDDVLFTSFGVAF